MRARSAAGDDAARRVGQAQVQAQHIGLRQRTPRARRRLEAVGQRRLARLASLPQTITRMPKALP
jgi:hypothetical protein